MFSIPCEASSTLEFGYFAFCLIKMNLRICLKDMSELKSKIEIKNSHSGWRVSPLKMVDITLIMEDSVHASIVCMYKSKIKNIIWVLWSEKLSKQKRLGKGKIKNIFWNRSKGRLLKEAAKQGCHYINQWRLTLRSKTQPYIRKI